uniref:Uncharacterized protein n=1 Tax=Meloidogyne enterolobii TaxID=390850 RepID=A0A6V7UT72_MELEN|nr:unnamed protein product [Meloidogyne enterolobii]
MLLVLYLTLICTALLIFFFFFLIFAQNHYKTVPSYSFLTFLPNFVFQFLPSFNFLLLPPPFNSSPSTSFFLSGNILNIFTKCAMRAFPLKSI